MDTAGNGTNDDNLASRRYRGAHRAGRRGFVGWRGPLAGLAILAVAGGTFVIVQLGQGDQHAIAAGSTSESPYPLIDSSRPGGPPTGSPSAAAAPSSSGASTASAPTVSARSTPSDPTTPTHEPVSPPTASSRKGVATWSFHGVNGALAQSGAGWYYTWSAGHAGIGTPHGVEFVPMIWGSGSVTDQNIQQAKSAGRYLLGFNEPDLSSQSNMSVNQALDLWPQLEATGQTLGSPAVASGAATPGGWLDQFMSGAKTGGYRVDFIALHWYGGEIATADAVSQLKSYLQAVWDRYHKPIWLTEYALINFSNGTHYPSESDQAAFLTASTKMLDSLSFLKRYAWFALPGADDGPSTGLFTSGPNVTDVGKAFETAD